MFQSKVDLRKQMPLLAKQEGKWIGTYLHFSASGAKIDEHSSLVECVLSGNAADAFVQTNTYQWADGKSETLVMPAQWKKGELVWKNEPYSGKIWQADNATLLSHWHHTDQPGTYLYEVLHMTGSSKERSRTWTWFQAEKIFRRTIIQETRKA